ncbi:unnamed protein product, partial [Ectocarpus fasciculatus]
MVAVLYGNVSYYSNSLHSRHASTGPPEDSAPVAQNLQVQSETLRDTPAQGEESDGRGDAADGRLTAEALSSKKELLPEEGQLPEPPAAATSAAEATEGAVEEGEGDWNDDGEAGGGGDGAGNGVHSLTVGGGSVAAGGGEMETGAGVDEGDRAEEGGEPGLLREEIDGGPEYQQLGEEYRKEEAADNPPDDMFTSEEAAAAGAAAAKQDAGTADGERNGEETEPQTAGGDVGDAADDGLIESTRGAGSQGEGGTADAASARDEGERGGRIDDEEEQDGIGPGAEDRGGGMAGGAGIGLASLGDELFGEGRQRATAAAAGSSSARRPAELTNGGGGDVGSQDQQQAVVDNTARRALLSKHGGDWDQQQGPQGTVGTTPHRLLQLEDIPDPLQQQQQQGAEANGQQQQQQVEANGVPEALVRPGGEGDQQQQPVWEEQQQQQPIAVELPAWMVELEPPKLVQPGGEGDQQQQPVFEEQQQQQQQQQPQQPPIEILPQGLLQPGELPDPQQQQQVEANGVPESLVQPGGEEDQQQQEQQPPVEIAPQGLLQPGELPDPQQQQETEANGVPEALVQPGGEEDQQQQPPGGEGDQQQQPVLEEEEQQQPVDVAPQGLLQPGELSDPQQRRLQLPQAEGNGIPEPLVQPGGGGDQQQQQQQVPVDVAPQGLLQPGELVDRQQQQQQQQAEANGQLQQEQESEESREALPQVEVRDEGAGAAAVAAVVEPPVVQASNWAAPGAMECATTKLGEGADSITNIATWRDVPGDATYRHPLAEENKSKYVTLQKDLGGFNNIRLSLECAVAFAAATGRTLVIPPPFQIWNMKGTAKTGVDLRELFSFDKLRASGRVSVITTAEFLEREAVTGNLGVQPDERVTLLDMKAVEAYLEEVAGQYDGGLPELSLEKAGLVMPRRVDEKVDLEDERYSFAKKWLYGRELLEYQGQPWEAAKVIHWRAKESRLLAPFYAFVLHADEVSDQYHKRLLRDLMHYPEEVYCKASQIISLLRQEDPSGEFSTFHVRRNDFIGMYKIVNVPLADVIANSL